MQNTLYFSRSPSTTPCDPHTTPQPKIWGSRPPNSQVNKIVCRENLFPDDINKTIYFHYVFVDINVPLLLSKLDFFCDSSLNVNNKMKFSFSLRHCSRLLAPCRNPNNLYHFKSWSNRDKTEDLVWSVRTRRTAI